jgi:hypothetical protein
MLVETVPLGGQPHPVRHAVEQLQAQRGFQLGDRGGDDRLGDVQLARSLRKLPQLGRFGKVPQLAQGHVGGDLHARAPTE